MCFLGLHPLNFIYDRKSNSFRLDGFKTDDDLVKRVQTGKGDAVFIHGDLGNNIFIEALFGGTSPKIPKQDYVYGDNDLKSAKAYRYKVVLAPMALSDGYTEEWRTEYEAWLYTQIVAWGEQSDYLAF